MINSSGILEWDSAFFQKKIAYIEYSNTKKKQDIKEIKAEIDRLQQIESECIYLFSCDQLNLDEYNAYLVDIKRTYILNDPVYIETKDSLNIVKPVYKGDFSDLYGLAIQSGEYSRFKIDPNFSEADFIRLYHKWIENSVDAGFADYVIVAIDNAPIGLITAKKKDDRIIIGLLATDSKYRGQGIGTRLIQEIKNEAYKNSLKLEVVTQADNKIACDFYEKMGFRKANDTYIYHIWRTINRNNI